MNKGGLKKFIKVFLVLCTITGSMSMVTGNAGAHREADAEVNEKVNELAYAVVNKGDNAWVNKEVNALVNAVVIKEVSAEVNTEASADVESGKNVDEESDKADDGKVNREGTEDGIVNVDVSYGIEGRFRGDTAIPINISVENNGADLSGQVEIKVPAMERDTYDAFVKEVNLQSGEKTKVIIPVNFPDDVSKFSVAVYDGEKVIEEKKYVISSGRLNEMDMFMGYLTDDLNGITLKNIDFKGFEYGNFKINQSINVSLNEELIRENEFYISALDVIVVNNYDLSAWSDKEYENLNVWLNNGGILILGSGENAAKTIGSLNKDFVDVDYRGTKDVNGYTAADFSVKDGAVVLGSNENPMVYSINRGYGKVYIASFDLANKVAAENQEVSDFWKNNLGTSFINDFNTRYKYPNSYVPHQMSSLMSNVPVDNEISFKGLIIIFVSYALIVGVLIYFVMKKFNKREYLWGVIPVIAVVFSIILYVMGSSTRVNDIILNQVNIINVDDEGNGQVRGSVGIGSKYKTNLEIKQPSDGVMNKYEDDYYRNSPSDNMIKLGTKTVYKGNESYYEFNDLSALNLKKFSVKNHEEIVPSIETQFKYDSENLLGTVKNTLGYDIERLILVSGINVWDLGKISGNEEKEINLNKYSSQGMQRFSDSISNDYYIKSPIKEDREKYKNILRISEILSAIGDERYLNNSTYLVAVTNMPVEYGFDFGEKSLSKYDITAIVQDTNIEFRDKDGNLNYPLGHYQGTADLQNELNIHMDHNEIYGNGSGLVSYKIDDLDVVSIKVGYIENQDSKGTLNGTASVYNYKTQSYDEIKYSKAGVNLDNSQDYVQNGEIIVKIDGKDEVGIGVPQIAVKGREK